MKHLLPLLLALSLLLASSALALESPPSYYYAGDTNGDGEVTAQDALVISLHLVSGFLLEGERFTAFDADGDSKITMQDVLIALRTAAGYIEKRPSSETYVPPVPPTPEPEPDPPTPDPPKPQPPANGWWTDGGKKYYYKNGAPLVGLQDIGGFRYKFNNNGACVSNVGIDVSYYQGDINWAKVKAAGVEFAMLRVGYRGYGSAGTLVEDTKFASYLPAAKAAGLKIGVYFYSQAITSQEGVAEANFALARLKNVALDYPVAYDIEEVTASATARTKTANLTTAKRTDFALAFCNTIKNAGFKAMIYSNKHWLENYLDTSRFGAFDTWLAHYSTTTTYSKTAYTIWQYSESGRVDGIAGGVDLNIGVKNY